MNIEIMQALLGWGSIINIGFLFFWGLMMLFAHDLVYRVHSSFYDLSEKSFDAIHYGGIGFYKILIILFYVVPYIALRLAS